MTVNELLEKDFLAPDMICLTGRFVQLPGTILRGSSVLRCSSEFRKILDFTSQIVLFIYFFFSFFFGGDIQNSLFHQMVIHNRKISITRFISIFWDLSFFMYIFSHVCRCYCCFFLFFLVGPGKKIFLFSGGFKILAKDVLLERLSRVLVEEEAEEGDEKEDWEEEEEEGKTG